MDVVAALAFLSLVGGTALALRVLGRRQRRAPTKARRRVAVLRQDAHAARTMATRLRSAPGVTSVPGVLARADRLDALAVTFEARADRLERAR